MIPTELFEQIKRVVELDDEHAHELLIAMLREFHGEPTAEDIAWAEEALRPVDGAA